MEKFIERMKNLPETLGKLGAAVSENLSFVVISVAIIIAFIALARYAENVLAKRRGESVDRNKNRTKRVVLIGVLSAIAMVLMLFEMPLFFAPGFYKLDLSEVPVLIGTFVMGPSAGITIEFIKILLNLLTTSTSTAFVGETANFIIGISFIVPAGIIYYAKKSKKTAIIGMACGMILCIIVGSLLNGYVLLPTYARVFGMDMSVLIGEGTKKNDAVSNLSTFLMFIVAPFNLLKCLVVSVITFPIYKPISNIAKADYSQAVPDIKANVAVK